MNASSSSPASNVTDMAGARAAASSSSEATTKSAQPYELAGFISKTERDRAAMTMFGHLYAAQDQKNSAVPSKMYASAYLMADRLQAMSTKTTSELTKV